jgi:hypothetical protein
MRSILSHLGSGSAASLFSLVLISGSALSAGSASAATLRVTNCSDSGAGSLRATVARAASGDTIDLTRLTCSRIVLTSGAVGFTHRDLTLVGPGRTQLVLDGNNASSLLFHNYGTIHPQTPGTLVVKSMSIANGGTSGRCVVGRGDVRLSGVDVHHCRAGGVYSEHDLYLSHSHLHSNVSSDYGGGAAAGGITAHYSRISNNTAAEYGGGLWGGEVRLTYSSVDGNSSGETGGGVEVVGTAMFNKSTVSNNAAAVGGGVFGREITLYDSTFSGNVAAAGSAVHARVTLTVVNSTVAFNEVRTTYPTNDGALSISTLWGPPEPGEPPLFRITSSIIARNLTNGAPGNDFGSDFSYVSGRNNLIERSPIRVPADTISADPRLAPLADNGGPTRTHALRCDSPAIDRGINPRNRMYDQRGPGFPRVAGKALDIGALEHVH